MQTWLINSMKNLGYKANYSGVCYGVAYMGIQAFLADDLATFNERLEIIKNLHLENLTANQFNLLLKKLRKQSKQEELIEFDIKAVEDIPAFFDGIELYQQAYHYPEFFEPQNAPSKQDALKPMPLLLSKKIENEGGIAHIDRFVGAYEKKDIINYFRSLQESYDTQPEIKDPIIFNFNSGIHAIAVGYDPISRQWTLIDANQLPARQILFIDKIAERVISAFSTNNIAVFSTEVFGSKKAESNLQFIVQNWKKNPKWQKIHQIDIESKIDINMVPKKPIKKDSRGSSLLTVAASEGHTKVVNDILIKNRDIINDAESDGYTALHLAIEHEHTEIINILLKYPIDPNRKNKDDFTPLYSAIKKGYLEIVERLLDLGADCNILSREGKALHIAAKYGQPNIIELLIKKDENVEFAARYSFEKSPLCLAVEYGHLEAVKRLISLGVNVNISLGATPLHVAAQQGNSAIIELLLTHGAKDVIEQKSNDMTPLLVAAKNGHLEAVKQLLNNGADITATCLNGASALYLAAENGHTNVLKFLMENGLLGYFDAACSDGSTPLFAAAANGHLDAVNFLLEHQPSLNVVRSDGFTPIMVAAKNNHADIVSLLLSKGADTKHIVTQFNAYHGENVLHIAIEKGHTNIVNMLLENHVDTNSVIEINSSTITLRTSALYLAVEKGQTEIVQLLLQHNANVNFGNYDNKTPLHIAAQNGYKDIVIALLANGANVDKKTDKNLTALNFAEQENHTEIIEILEKHKIQNYLTAYKIPLDASPSKLGFFKSKELQAVHKLWFVMEGKKPVDSLKKFEKELKDIGFGSTYHRLMKL